MRSPLLLLALLCCCCCGRGGASTSASPTVNAKSNPVAPTLPAGNTALAPPSVSTAKSITGLPPSPKPTSPAPVITNSKVSSTRPAETVSPSALGTGTAKPISPVSGATSAKAAASEAPFQSPTTAASHQPPANSASAVPLVTKSSLPVGGTKGTSVSPVSPPTGSPVQTYSAPLKPTDSPAMKSPAVNPSPTATKGGTTVAKGPVTSSKEQGSSATSKVPVLVTQPPGHTTLRLGTSGTVTRKPGEKQDNEAAQTDGAVSETPASSPTTLATAMPTMISPERYVPSSEVNNTWFPAQNQITCEKETVPEDKALILTLNRSTSCLSLQKNPLEEPLFGLLCRAEKPTFNQSKDRCTVRLASVAEGSRDLAVVGVSVQTNSMAEELFESLMTKKGELEKIGINNVTYAGKILDIDSEDRFSMPLIITIVCMAASLLLVAAIYGCCHQRISQRKDQQRLTEELQTMENGYHDNPTLEVMETSSDMQEKKVNLNGELGDSWIVPMENLMKEELDEEEDTHL